MVTNINLTLARGIFSNPNLSFTIFGDTNIHFSRKYLHCNHCFNSIKISDCTIYFAHCMIKIEMFEIITCSQADFGNFKLN